MPYGPCAAHGASEGKAVVRSIGWAVVLPLGKRGTCDNVEGSDTYIGVLDSICHITFFLYNLLDFARRGSRSPSIFSPGGVRQQQ